MRRIAKVTRIAFLLLLLIGAGVFCLLVSANSILQSQKERVERYLSEATDSLVSIGSIHIAVRPLPALSLEHVRISDRDGCYRAVTINRIGADAKLRDLLSKRLAIVSISVVEPRIDVTVESDRVSISKGENDPCSKKTASTDRKAQKEAQGRANAPSSDSQDPVDIAFTLKEITIEGGSVTFRKDDSVTVFHQVNIALNSPDKAYLFDLANYSFNAEGTVSIAADLSNKALASFGSISLKLNKASFSAAEPLIVSGIVDIQEFEAAHPLPALSVQMLRSPFELVLEQNGALTLKSSMAIEGLGYDNPSFSVRNLNAEIPNIALAANQGEKNESSITVDIKKAHSKGTALSGLKVHFSSTPAIETNKDQGLSGGGSVAIDSLKWKSLSLENMLLKVQSVDRTQNKDLQLSGSLSFNKFKTIDGVDKYKVHSLSGPISLYVKSFGGAAFNGTMDVKGFGFEDDETKIDNVDGSLRKIKGELSNKGDVEVNVLLTDGSIDLEHPEVRIKARTSVSSPVRVRVPAKGGYEVSGPVRISDADIHTAGRDFKGIVSTVHIFVSGPKKDFKTSNIAFQFGELLGDVATQFTMTKDLYRVHETHMNLHPGFLKANVDILRDGSKQLSGKVEIFDLSVARLMGIVSPEKDEEYIGLIETFDAEFSARSNKLQETLEAEGALVAQKGFYKNTSVSEKAFRALSGIPGFSVIGTPKQEELRPEIVKSDFTIAERRIDLKKAKLQHEGYNLEGSGFIKFDRTSKFTANLVLLRETIGTLGFGIGPLKRLFSELGNVAYITVPLNIDGTFPDLNVKVDMVKFSKDKTGLSIIERALDRINVFKKRDSKEDMDTDKASADSDSSD